MRPLDNLGTLCGTHSIKYFSAGKWLEVEIEIRVCLAYVANRMGPRAAKNKDLFHRSGPIVVKALAKPKEIPGPKVIGKNDLGLDPKTIVSHPIKGNLKRYGGVSIKRGRKGADHV